MTMDFADRKLLPRLVSKCMILIVLLLLPCFAHSQERPEEDEAIRKSETPEGKREVQDILRGVTKMKRIEIDEWLASNPGKKESDYWNEQEYYKKSADAQEAIKKRGERFLSSPAAAGWGYQETIDIPYPGYPPLPMPVTGGAHSPAARSSNGFLITQNRSLERTESPVYTNTIRMHWRAALPATNLTRFFEVNNEILKDIPLQARSSPLLEDHPLPHGKTSPERPPAYPGLLHSHAIVITGSHLGRDEEVITVFDLSDSAETGALVGDMYPISTADRTFPAIIEKPAPLAAPKIERPSNPFEVQTDPFALRDLPAKTAGDRAREQDFVSSPVRPVTSPSKSFEREVAPLPTPPVTIGRVKISDLILARLARGQKKRIYYYGDTLENIDLEATAQRLGYEFIRRTTKASQNLLQTERRLEQIDNRAFDQSQLTVVNGIPQTADAVAKMGMFVGDPEMWLRFNKEVEKDLDGRATKLVTDRDGFLRELSEGDSDILILVAHSSGTYLYLNGQKLSFKELQQLPKRKKPSVRPRVAVLITCDAGRGTARAGSSNSGSWSRFFRSDIIPLAQVLVEHGWVDKVLAPDHRIQPNESITVLKRALDGATTNSIFKSWVTWALNFLDGTEPQS
jgi:hypothetical protein